MEGARGPFRRRAHRAALAGLVALAVVGVRVEARAAEDEDGGRANGTASARADALDVQAIGRAAGTKARRRPDGTVRIGWSREDVSVRVDGKPLEPAAGLGSWAAFRAAGDGALVMGDTVVFEDEITPALDAALAAGLELTALHNHFAFDRPPVYFMHLRGRGEAESLAAAVERVWDAIREVREAHPEPRDRFPGAPPEPGPLDAEALGAILGREPEPMGEVLKVSFPREGRVGGTELGGSMGLSTWAAFSGSDARATVDGDFAMTAGEVQPVVRALRAADLHVVALHNHMLEEEPRLFFLHYWGKGPAAELAEGLARAREAQESASGRP